MSGDPSAPPAPLRIAFVPGVTPGKWLRIWEERSPEPATATMVSEDVQTAVLRDDTVDMALVRLPVEREGYTSSPSTPGVPVVVVPKGHVVTALDKVALADLADDPSVDLATMTAEQAIAVVASGTGHVIVPMSIARLYHRKDVETRPMSDVEQTQIGLAWLVDNDDPRLEQFIGVVRGRTERSSRAEPTPPQVRSKKKVPTTKAPSATRRGKPTAPTKRAQRPARGKRPR